MINILLKYSQQFLLPPDKTTIKIEFNICWVLLARTHSNMCASMYNNCNLTIDQRVFNSIIRRVGKYCGFYPELTALK